MAREIQEGFLPSEFPDPEKCGYELYARVLPAREVAGDLYDFFVLPDKRLVFFVGDVSGKGMPAALFMVAVRTLGRHIASGGDSPAQTLAKMNAALAADNPSAMFVTLVHGIYHPDSGEVVAASAGHPPPLLRQADGRVDMLQIPAGRLLGYEGLDLDLTDSRFTLAPNETLMLYTDGYTEARAPQAKTMLGIPGLKAILSGPKTPPPLQILAERARGAVEKFTGSSELQDDLTLLLLRRATSGKNT